MYIQLSVLYLCNIYICPHRYGAGREHSESVFHLSPDSHITLREPQPDPHISPTGGSTDTSNLPGDTALQPGSSAATGATLSLYTVCSSARTQRACHGLYIDLYSVFISSHSTSLSWFVYRFIQCVHQLALNEPVMVCI